MGKKILAGLDIMVEAILDIMESRSLQHLVALSVRLSIGYLVLIAACSVRYSFLFYLEVLSIVVD